MQVTSVQSVAQITQRSKNTPLMAIIPNSALYAMIVSTEKNQMNLHNASYQQNQKSKPDSLGT